MVGKGMRAGLGMALALAVATPAGAAVPLQDRQMVVFYTLPSINQIDAAHRSAPGLFAKARATHRPIEIKTAMAGGLILLSLQSVAICNRDRGCPLLVFTNIFQPPVLRDMSFENILIEYGKTGESVVLRTAGPDRACAIPRVGRAVCREVPRQ
jgi:hypothetical protein